MSILHASKHESPDCALLQPFRTTRVHLGRTHVALGDAARAKEILERAATLLCRDFGPEHPEVAPALQVSCRGAGN